MKILMVYPHYPDTFWGFRHALKFIDGKASFPPLGLLTVAAMLPRDWGKNLVDMNGQPLADLDLAWANYVFISAMPVRKDSVREVIDRCRKLVSKDRRARPALHSLLRGLSRGGPSAAGRGRAHPPPLSGRFGGRSRSEHVLRRLSGRSSEVPLAALGADRPEKVRGHESAVLPRLPLRLRVLRHHDAFRPQDTQQGAGAVPLRVGEPLQPRLTRGRVHRR